MTTCVYTAPIEITESATLKAVAVAPDGTISQVMAVDFVIGAETGRATLAFTQQPVVSGGYVSYGTQAIGVVAAQSAQAESAAAVLILPAIASEAQPAQSSSLAASLRISGSVAETQAAQQQQINNAQMAIGQLAASQAPQTTAISAQLSLAGVVSESQTTQVAAIAAQTDTSAAPTLRYTQQPTVVAGTVYYGTEEISMAVYGSVAQLSPLQQELALATLILSGDLAGSQAPQFQESQAYLRYDGVVDQSQVRQSQHAIGSISLPFSEETATVLATSRLHETIPAQQRHRRTSVATRVLSNATAATLRRSS